MSIPKDYNQGSQGSQDDLMRIVADIARVNAHNGLEPGTGAFRLELSPLQLVRLAQELSNEALQALGLALHFGKIRTDPIRVELLGWSRQWLMDQGMRHGPAQKAAAELERKGFLSVTKTGKVGTPGPHKLAILKGGRFGWDDKSPESVAHDTQQASLETPEAQPDVLVVEPQVSPSERKPLRRTAEPVDNTVSSSERKPLRRAVKPVDKPAGSTEQKPLTRPTPPGTQPAGFQVNPQANTLEWILNGRANDPSTTSSKKKKESLSSSSWSDGTLTRTALDQFLLSEPLGDALRARPSEAIAVLSVALSGTTDLMAQRTKDRASAALGFMGVPAGEHPQRDLAALLVTLLALPSGGRAGPVNRMTEMMRAKGARVPALAPGEVLAGLVLVLVASLSTEVGAWGGWVPSGLKRSEWTTSAPLVRTLEALTAMVTGVPVKAARAGGITIGVDGPSGSVDDPAYLADLRAAVAGTPDEDEVMFETLLKNQRRQALVLMRYQQRARKETTVQDTADGT